MFDALNYSILQRAQKNNLIEINTINIRNFSLDNNKRCDDYSYGGGAGMIMTPQPLYDAIMSVKTKKSHVVYLSPKGKLLNQKIVEDMQSKYDHLILVCGHYEGIDERVIDLCVDEEISIGDYVLTGGELPAMVLVDAISRYIPNVLGNSETTSEESFCGGLLEYPQYTRPVEFCNKKVPDVLVSGNHKEVAKWRQEMSFKITKERRPDLLKDNELTIFINKPAKEVFEFSLESKNVPKWILGIKKEIPSELPVKLGTKLKNIGVKSKTWNSYEVIDFDPPKTFTLKRLNGDYFVRYTCVEKDGGTQFEYYEWAEKGTLDGLMQMDALERLKYLIENQ